MNPINSFTGEHRFLSNFWPVEVEMDFAIYPSVEHAYQAAKTFRPDTRMIFQDFSLTAGDAKRLARKIVIRPDWEDSKLAVMTMLVSQKFMFHPELGAKLCATRGRDLIEGNTWNDTFWGVCNGFGKNHLGEILMEIRATLLGQWDKIYTQELLV